MEAAGYAYVDRFTSFRKRAGVLLNLPGAKATTKLKAPDFVVEKTPLNRALVESKGGFVAEGKTANIKGAIAEALDQLAPWGSQFKPAITKKFAIGTFLREPGEADAEPSLMVVVDPEGGQDENASEVPRDAVRRANYAFWLETMGYSTIARGLARGVPTQYSVKFLVSEFMGTEYAFVPIGLAPRSLEETGVVDLLDWPNEPFLSPWRHLENGHADVIVAALDLSVLKQIGLASASGEADPLLELPDGSFTPAGESRNGDAVGSRFIDGSFIGSLNPSVLWGKTTRSEAIRF
jgi:hypothetical protein